MSGPGALLGLAAGAGLWLVLAGLPVRPALDRRLAPSLADPDPAPSSRPPGARLLAAAARGLDRTVGGRAGVRRRLAASGDPRPVARFRAEQVLCGLAGLLAGGLAGTAVTVASGRWWAPPLLAVAGALSGGLARDLALSRRVRRRQAAVLAELPVVAELLALAVTAGEGLAGALDRVCRLTTGALPAELAGALARVRAGTPLAAALADLRDRAGLPALARFLDGVLVAVERGTPLAEVLRAQAADVREAGTRALLASGGRREIAMLVPVVFGILPTTVVFALYPGLVAIATLTALG
ncbi:MAG TPA: type II secretion system F family protein [Mycobacteriales bacterium]|nr:type II secretion system F family protein [Mycobacteriales bacterium]